MEEPKTPEKNRTIRPNLYCNTGFRVFFVHYGPKFQKLNPGLSYIESRKRIKEVWNSMSRKERQKYINIAVKMRHEVKKLLTMHLAQMYRED